MPRTLSEIKKKEMVAAFKKGVNLDELSSLYKLKVITIKKHLKNSLGETEFKETINLKQIKEVNVQYLDGNEGEKRIKVQNDENLFEIPPLNETYDFGIRKDFASKPLKDFELPENIFLIVNKSIDFTDCPYDEKTYKMLQSGNNIGNFTKKTSFFKSKLILIQFKLLCIIFLQIFVLFIFF